MGLLGTIAAITSVGTTAAAGIVQNREARKQAKSLDEQAALQLEESKQDADLTRSENARFKARQTLAFLSSGVSLAGSPLQVLADTEQEGERQAESILQRGAAVSRVTSRQSSVTRNQGRAALFGSLVDAGVRTGSFIAKKKGLDDQARQLQ